MTYQNCTLCPRECGVDRTKGEKGFCRCPDTAMVAKVMLHEWEEPALAEKYSGAIFFSGCTLGCSYCQNRAISRGPSGTAMDSAGLRRCMEELIAQGAENIDLVTPTQYLPTILPALSPKLPVPVVYNCGGYESVKTLRKLEGLVDIYLPDFKYGENGLGRELSHCPDYFETAAAAIREMVRQVGKPQWDGEKLTKGVLVRHLVLPGNVGSSLKVLDFLGENFPDGEILVSLMGQYTPMPGLNPPLHRPITPEEYDSALSWMLLNDLPGFAQELTAGEAGFIPDF